MKLYSKKKFYKHTLLFCMFLSTIFFIFVSIFCINKSHAHEQLILSHKQLIILSNYMYLDDCATLMPIKDKLESYKTNNKYDKSCISLPASGIKDSQMIEMFKEIEKDSLLLNLVPVAYIETDIRAVCFVPSSNVGKEHAEAVLVFLGTKALNNAWLDCLEGSYYEDTLLQLEALDFYNTVSEFYNITTITGHSKGGNLAQYVTITGKDSIRNCVSFNGQGFSNMFINKYNQKIANNVDKITSVVSYKEPVNTLLNPIANNTLIINTDNNVDTLSSHVSSYLYNSSFFDENGNYLPSAFTTRTTAITTFDNICDKLVNNLDAKYLKYVSQKSAPILGTLIPILQDAMAREDVSLLRGFIYEINKRIEQSNNNKLTENDITYLENTLYNSANYSVVAR